MQKREVVIVGGGPGGSSVSGRLAQRGRDVLVLERDRFPRFHIGESLLPMSRQVLEELGLESEMENRFLRKYGARFICCRTDRQVRYAFADAFNPAFEYAYQVQRADFDHLLLRQASHHGVEVREGWEVTKVLFDGDRATGVRACPRAPDGTVGDEEDIAASVVVDCTGRDSIMASRLRTKARVASLDKTAMFSHFEGIPRPIGESEGDIEIIVFEHGWFWVIPFRGGTTSVGAVCSSDWIRAREKGESLDDFFQRTVRACPAAEARLSGATKVRPAVALADFSYRVQHLCGDGWLVAGDAAGFLDPLFSTGAHLALKGGDLAASAIDEALRRGDTSAGAFSDYEKQIRYAIDMFLGVVQGFYAGKFRDLLFVDKQRPAMRRVITSLLAGDVFHDDGPTPPRWAGFVKQYSSAHFGGANP